MRRIIMAGLAGPLLAAAAAIAQFESELAPREVEGGAESALPFDARRSGDAGEADGAAGDRSPVLVPRLHSVTLLAGAGTADGGRIAPGAVGVLLHGLTVEEDGLRELLAPSLGQPLTADGLERMIDAILGYYERSGRPVTDVLAPGQDLRAGDLLLEVIEGRVGTVGIESGGIFNDELLGGAVRLRGGDLLRAGDLQEHLDWFNRNPFRPATLYAAPGLGEGEADLVFALSERRPWRVYAGYENSGAEAAGENRYLAGVNWGDAFGLDQILSYQFTMGDSYDDLHAHAVQWEIPIHPWHHFVRISGGWAEIRTETESAGEQLVLSGTSWQLGAAYGLHLPRWNDFRQELTAGVELKSSDNFLVFGGDEAHPGAVVEIAQFRSDYRATRRGDASAWEVEAALVGAPGGLLDHNDSADFAVFRPGAKAAYLYARTRVSWVRRLPERWSLRAVAQAQLASGALLPTEQLALGGHATVRGYEEREFLADHGYALSAELRAPGIEINFPTSLLPDPQVQFLGFVDHGIGWRDGTPPREDASVRFLGVGIGARIQAGSHLNLRSDLALPIDGGSGLRAHLGVTVSF